jgi:hypothetical protein
MEEENENDYSDNNEINDINMNNDNNNNNDKELSFNRLCLLQTLIKRESNLKELCKKKNFLFFISH